MGLPYLSFDCLPKDTFDAFAPAPPAFAFEFTSRDTCFADMFIAIVIKNKTIATTTGRLLFLQNQIKQLKESIDKVKELEKKFEIYSLYIKEIGRAHV